ncbi:membrane-associated protein [Caballeronia sordidicola]|uniref:Membrane-associated protein n=1 Tax=Caballeronia sordidicola TaxID=196367 RepID=A0A158HI97_CABSO|nr:membrane-associated protein [Caballeronia sordidicola]
MKVWGGGHLIQIPPSAITSWGSAVVFVNVLVTRLGVPLPIIPVLLFAGSAIAAGLLVFSHVLLAAVLAALIGDFAWFSAGRIYGARLTDFFSRRSLSVDASIRTTRNLFERFGIAIVAVAKFVPGLALITPPLMGTTMISPLKFVAWDAAGTLAWASFWLLGGALFEQQLAMLLIVLRPYGASILDVLAASALFYLIYRYVLRWRVRRWLRRRVITPRKLSELMRSNSPPVVVDARKCADRDEQGVRIPGARLLDPDFLESIDIALRAATIVVYSSSSDVAARRVSRRLRAKGFVNVRTLYGGLDEWVRLGYAVEPLPPDFDAMGASMARS